MKEKKNLPSFGDSSRMQFEESNMDSLVNYFPEKTFFQYNSNQVIFEEAEITTSIYCLMNGIAKASKLIDNKAFTLSLASAGQIFGLESFINNVPFSFSLTTLSSCTFCAIRKADFVKAIETDTVFALQLMKMIKEEIDHLENRFDQLNNHSIQSRIAGLIIKLNEWFGIEFSGVISSRLDFKDLANLSRISEVHLSRILEEFRKKKYLEIVQKNIVVLNEEGLKREWLINT